eukprot:1152209-Pelagomonas_calceolata.AAC.7
MKVLYSTSEANKQGGRTRYTNCALTGAHPRCWSSIGNSAPWHCVPDYDQDKGIAVEASGQ